jgi:hypothetical protein
MINNELSYVICLEAPLSTYHPILDTTLEDKPKTKAISILENLQYEEDPPPLTSKKVTSIYQNKSATYRKSSSAFHLVKIKPY